MPGGALLETLNHVEESLRRIEVSNVSQDVRFGADELIRLSQVGNATATDNLPRYPGGERIAGDAGESV